MFILYQLSLKKILFQTQEKQFSRILSKKCCTSNYHLNLTAILNSSTNTKYWIRFFLKSSKNSLDKFLPSSKNSFEQEFNFSMKQHWQYKRASLTFSMQFKFIIIDLFLLASCKQQQKKNINKQSYYVDLKKVREKSAILTFLNNQKVRVIGTVTKTTH